MPNLVGIGNSQVPTNAMLGGLAYEDFSVLDETRSGRKNMIINGAMTLAQRGSTISAASYTTAAYGACDRWKLRAINTDEADFVVSQESDAPTGSGFSRSLKIKTNTVV